MISYSVKTRKRIKCTVHQSFLHLSLHLRARLTLYITKKEREGERESYDSCTSTPSFFFLILWLNQHRLIATNNITHSTGCVLHQLGRNFTKTFLEFLSQQTLYYVCIHMYIQCLTLLPHCAIDIVLTSVISLLYKYYTCFWCTIYSWWDGTKLNIANSSYSHTNFSSHPNNFSHCFRITLQDITLYTLLYIVCIMKRNLLLIIYQTSKTDKFIDHVCNEDKYTSNYSVFYLMKFKLSYQCRTCKICVLYSVYI